MTAIIESRPRIPRLAMVFIAAVVVMLLTAPKAGAWNQDVGDFTVSRTKSSEPVTVTAYNGGETNITFPTEITYTDYSGNSTTYPITDIGENVLAKFKGMNDITVNVTIPENYTTIDGNAFKDCTVLKDITIPGSIESIQYSAFEGCSNLESVTFQDGSASSLKFGMKVFLNCTSLNSIALPSRTSNMNAAVFGGCSALNSITIGADCKNYFAQDGILYQLNDDGNGYTVHSYTHGASATGLSIPSEVNGKPVTSIFRMTFQNNAKLQSVTIPASVTDFKSSCFDGCSALKKVSINAESVTLGSSAFTNLPAGSVIEVANETVKNAFEPTDKWSTYYTAANTTVQVKGSEPEPEAAPAASLTVKGAGVKDGYSYYTVKLDSAANLSTLTVDLSFDATKVSKDAQASVKDSKFSLQAQTWKEEGGKVKAHLLLTPADVKTAVTTDTASSLLLLALPVKAGITGDIAMTVSAECAGVVSTTPTNGTVTVNGSPASNRIANYDVYADGKIDILDITEAQRFYQVSSSDTDNWSVAQKADVNGDNKVDIQDLIDIFLQIEF